MVNILGILPVTFNCMYIEWPPKDWSNRKAWGPDAIDGMYLTKSGEIYRLSGNLVIYVTQEEHLQ